MRPILVILGIALVVSGLVVSFVPLFDGPSEVLTSSHPTAAFNATTTLSLTPDWTVALSWNSNLKVSLLVVVCRSINASGSSMESTCPGATYTVMNGTSGGETFSVPLRGALLIGIVSSPSHGLRVDVQLRPTLVSVGAVLVIGGAATAVVGVLLRRKPRATPAGSSKPAGSTVR